MEYDGIENVELNVEENQWLDVTYTAKKYLAEEQDDLDVVRKYRPKKSGGFFDKFKNIFRSQKPEVDQSIDNQVVCDENSQVDCPIEDNIKYTAREYSQKPQPKRQKRGVRSAVLRFVVSVVIVAVLVGGIYIVDQTMDGQIVEMAKQTFLAPVFSFGVTPSAVNEISIPCTVNVDNVADGVITFSGGSVLLSFTKGTVSTVGESSITVAINDSTSIIYDNVTEVLVNVGDSVDTYSVLAKYTESATACILHNGEIVLNVVGSTALIQWSI